MNLVVVIFCVALVAVGHGITHLSGIDLRPEERVAYGAVLGPITVSTIAFPIAWWAGMNATSVVVATILALVVASRGWRRAALPLGGEWSDFWSRLRRRPGHPDNPWPLVVLTVAGAVISARILALAYGRSPDGGVTVGHLSTFGDWSAHLAYAGSFVYGDNFPPELPTAAGENFGYHFGVDYFAALFVPLGLDLFGALQVSAGFLAIAFPAVMYCAGLRLVRSRGAAFLGTVLFTLAGATLAGWQDGVFGSLPEGRSTYAFDGFAKSWFDNPVLGFLYPQRPTLVGFPLTLMLVAMASPLVLRDREAELPGRRGALLLGVLAGVLPVWHVFAYPIVVGLWLFWAAVDRLRRAEWLWLLAPALLIGIPLLIWELPPRSGVRIDPWWVLGFDENPTNVWRDLSVGEWFEFWFFHTGVFLPLLVVALVWRAVIPGRLALALAPLWALFVMPQIGIWHHWEGNNAKYIAFLVLLGAPLVAKVLVEASRLGALLTLGAAFVVVFSTLTGALDVREALRSESGVYPFTYLTPSDLLIGEWARDHTEPQAVFASAPDNHHAIRTVGARRVVSGASGRLRDLGIDFAQRSADVTAILRAADGEEAASLGASGGYEALLRRYDVDYVVVGPAELRTEPEAARIWAELAPVAYDLGGYQVYDVRQLAAAGSSPEQG